MQWLYILLCAYQFIYKYRCLKDKVIKTNFLGNDVPKKYIYYTCIACKNHPQIYLQSVNLNSNSDSGSGLELSDSESDLTLSDPGSDDSDSDDSDLSHQIQIQV